MIRLLLVEDDAPIRRGIERHINWERAGIGEVVSASNAEAALLMLDEKKPDIVLSDIRMPGMDGVQLCRKIRERLPEVQIIFISGFSDKEYLQAAIELGVAGYVEKPIDTDELETVLEKAAKLVRMMRDRVRSSLHTLLYFGEDTAFDLPEDRHGIMLLIYSEKAFEGIHEIAARLAERLNEISSDRYETLGGNRNEHYSAVFISRNRAWTESAAKRAREELLALRNPKDRWFVTSGRDFCGTESARLSYNDARDAVLSLGYTGWNREASYRETVTEWHGAVGREEITDFYRALENRDREAALAAVDGWYRKFTEEKAILNFDARNVFWRFDLAAGSFEPESRPFPEELKTFEELRDHVKEHIERVLFVGAGTGEDSPITRACLYIDRHIGDANLTAADVAEAAGLSPAYLGTVFSGQMGMTLVQYITAARLRRAVALLSDPAVRLSDVAAMCGYNDRKYFNKVFKSKMQVSPAEYRENLK